MTTLGVQRTLGLAAALLVLVAPAQAQFTTHTVADGLRFGYQVAIADLNGDDRPDLIGLGAQMTELVWFENPGWERHVIASDVGGMINLDTADLDADGIPEIALAYGYGMNPARSAGNIAILRHSGDPTEPWTLTEIDAVPMSHRVRFGSIDDSGLPVLINAPMLNANASGMADPDRLPTPLIYYRPGEWQRATITDQNEGVVHGLLPWDGDGDGRAEVLTAGRLGIHLHRYTADGEWSREALSTG
ncbi:MAG: VCBS repeat-containing protein, partial [Gammaproteobacteria bacterium]|nr:VCBS repeat-containing protein [Gammaproteobacteria bacterium]